MTKTAIENPRFEIDANWHDGILYVSSIALMWEEAGARFHVWLQTRGANLGLPQEAQSMGADFDACIYKNPPLALKRGDAGHFDTRQLDGTKPINRARYLDAFATAGGLPGLKRAQFHKGKELRAADELAAKERAARARLDKIADHGELLLNAARDVIANPADPAWLARLKAICDAADPQAPKGWQEVEAGLEETAPHDIREVAGQDF